MFQDLNEMYETLFIAKHTFKFNSVHIIPYQYNEHISFFFNKSIHDNMMTFSFYFLSIYSRA